MAIIKSYTDISQSKKLAEILPLESADNYYSWHDERYYVVNKDCPYPYSLKAKIPCWSLAALLGVLPNENIIDKTSYGKYYCLARNIITENYDNPVDACVGMIEKLHNLNLL